MGLPNEQESSRCTPHHASKPPIQSPICDADGSEILQDPAFDAAAFPLLPLVDAVPEIVGLGRVGAVGEAVEGMPVVRVGVVTGLVRGVVTLATPQRIEIARPGHYPAGYCLGEPGDSGAVWLSYPNLDLIGLHIAKSHAGLAIASPLKAVLQPLGLAPLQ